MGQRKINFQPKRGKYEPFASHTWRPPVKRCIRAIVPLEPHLRIIEDSAKGTAVVLGSDFSSVEESACNLVFRGYVPVEDEYFLMQHKRTKRCSHFRRITFVK